MKPIFLSLLLNMIVVIVLGQSEKVEVLSIGQQYQGGIIFFLDPSGQHGLISAPFDQINGACWGPEVLTNACFMDDGNLNTKKIIEKFKEKTTYSRNASAACLCDTLRLGGYEDWYLPSVDELLTLNSNHKLVGKFVIGFYCSSTEYNKRNCWSVNFDPRQHRGPIFTSKVSKGYSVRCIRNF
jgi:hypothetical protein